MDISKLKIGQKVWLTNEKVYGEVCGKTKSGWIRVMVSGTLKRVHISKIARVEPPKKKGVGDKGLIGPFDVLFDELSKEDQARVLKASRSCKLPIRTVMEELELT
tara:strand:+ start:448 stop:762 length:315 start_codon:yes stop_codon:yes gene_type:complete